MRAVAVWSPMVAGLLLMSLVVTSTVRPPLPAFAQDGACPPNPSPPNPTNPAITVNTPVAGQRVASPVLVSGRADVFEATVSIRIFDASGRVIADTFTSGGTLGTPLPFSARVPFTVSREQAGCVRVFEVSARDGRPINVVQREVMLVPGVRPPSTGDGSLADVGSDGRHELLGLGAAASMSVLLGVGLLRRLRT
jgi:Immunoglobulin-like domain of bacterial spore germination